MVYTVTGIGFADPEDDDQPNWLEVELSLCTAAYNVHHEVSPGSGQWTTSGFESLDWAQTFIINLVASGYDYCHDFVLPVATEEDLGQLQDPSWELIYDADLGC
jgi:hypothetical protein